MLDCKELTSTRVKTKIANHLVSVYNHIVHTNHITLHKKSTYLVNITKESHHESKSPVSEERVVQHREAYII